jgi:DNA polymerase-3 subunit delta'
MGWSSVIGQERVKKLLKSAIQHDRLPHAFLFFGPAGVGKDALAIELARTLNCEKSDIEGCGNCLSCRRIDKLQHPKLKLVFALPVGKSERVGDPPLEKLDKDDFEIVKKQIGEKAKDPYHEISVPKANSIKINSIRDIRREISHTAFGKGRRVVIISDADNMNTESSNALLKTLEEPAGDTMLILTTSRKDNLLPTIISRCQPVRFDPLRDQDIEQALVERENVDAQEARLDARLAAGSYSKALQYVGEDLGGKRKEVLRLLELSLGKEFFKLVSEIEPFSRGEKRAKVEQLLSLLLLLFRDIAVSSERGDSAITNIDMIADLDGFRRKYPNADIQSALSEIQKSLDLVGKNVNLSVVLISLFLNLNRIITA